MENVRVALYARVSTIDKGQDPELQLRELREYAGRRGWTIVAECVDNGVSGAKESRPALNRLLQGCATPQFRGGRWHCDDPQPDGSQECWAPCPPGSPRSFKTLRYDPGYYGKKAHWDYVDCDGKSWYIWMDQTMDPDD